MKDKVVFVTGGGSGIGRACALAFAARGACVAVVGRTRSKCEAVARKLGEHALPITADVARSVEVQQAIAHTVERFGRLDVVLHSAGISPSGRVTDISEEEWDTCIATDLTSAFLIAKYAIPHLRTRGGVILNVAGTFGIRAATGKAAYSAAKAGLINLSRSIALDYAREGIRCNAICPGYVDTPLTAGVDPAARDAFLDRFQPLRGVVSTDEVAALAVYLASDAAKMMTGQVFVIDGGQQAGLFVR
ncbi:MAG: short-chain dehydrogenase [Candidatus Roseilinea sp.]|nr:MAG: short-chain dehydrogenase [Candidatus Roseilinea sp.]